MAFNGEGTTGTYSPDLLTPAVDLTDSEFPWINHTFSHENLDAVSYDVAYREITRNNQIAASMGFTDYDRRAMVTPDVSGLKNPEAMSAAYDAGIRFLITDTSQPGQDNPTPQAGIYNWSEPGILMVPRRPVNLFYNVTTPTEWTNEYNSLYRSFWGRDLTYSEILDKESDVLLQYLLRGEIDPWMFHQANLRAYDGVHFLLGDLLDRTLEKYSRIFVLPLRTKTLAALGEWTKARMQYNTGGNPVFVRARSKDNDDHRHPSRRRACHRTVRRVVRKLRRAVHQPHLARRRADPHLHHQFANRGGRGRPERGLAHGQPGAGRRPEVRCGAECLRFPTRCIARARSASARRSSGSREFASTAPPDAWSDVDRRAQSLAWIPRRRARRSSHRRRASVGRLLLSDRSVGRHGERTIRGGE